MKDWSQEKWVCDRCDWCGPWREVLIAPNPFDERDVIHGCPDCKEVASLQRACDVPSCTLAVSCGFPTPEGYRNTCSKHYREFAALSGDKPNG
jgi:hypothetical protein